MLTRRSSIAALLLLLLHVRPALAEVVRAPEPIVAMVVPAAEEPGLTPLVMAIRSQLHDIPVEFETVVVEQFSSVPAEQAGMARSLVGQMNALVVLWCDLEPPAQVTFIVQGSSDQAPIVRQVSGEGQGGTLDALALIVRGVVRAALQRAEEPRDDPADSRAAVPPVPLNGPERSQPDPWRWLDIELAYAYQPFSADNPDTHAIQFGLTFNLHEHWCVLAGFRYFLTSVTGSSESARIRLLRYPASLGARLHWRLGDLELAVDLLAALSYVESQTQAPGLEINQDRSSFEFTIVPSARLGYRVFPRFWMFLSLGAEIFINRGRYVVIGVQGREQVLNPWPVRPQVVFGFNAEIF